MFPHEVLGISSTATVEEAKKAYRKLIVKYHPDVNHAPNANEMTKAVIVAFEEFKSGTNSPPPTWPFTTSSGTTRSSAPPAPPPKPAAPPSKPINLFPHGKVRPGQDTFIKDIWFAIENNLVMFAHAPTGLGKTAAALAPCLEYALQNGKTVLFLTPKQSQHQIVINTLQSIEKVLGVPLRTVDIISKSSMCPLNQGNKRSINYGDFSSMCRDLQKTKRCPYARMGNDSDDSSILDNEISREFPGTIHVEEFSRRCEARNWCPTKTAQRMMKYAKVIVCDYSYLFSDIYNLTLQRAELSYDDLVVIVDEAHNLPDRIRDMNSGEVDFKAMDEAVEEIVKNAKEMKSKFEFEDSAEILSEAAVVMAAVVHHIKEWIRDVDVEVEISKFDFVPMIERIVSFRYPKSYETFLAESEFAISIYSEDDPSKAMNFIQLLRGFNRDDQRCYKAIVPSKYGPVLRFRLIDPAIVSAPILRQVNVAILMSGTLTPIKNFQRQLGLSNARSLLKEYPSPFPKKNKLTLIDRRMDTKFGNRTDAGYKNLRTAIQEAILVTPGAVAVFAPSYDIMNRLRQEFSGRTEYVEERGSSKEERRAIYDAVMGSKSVILWAVQGGSFSEGIDFKDNALDMVIVVGLAIPPPSPEIDRIESYYDQKFGQGNGRYFSTIVPAINKAVQSGGRGIRSETDRGVVYFLDSRFESPCYSVCFPADLKAQCIGTLNPLNAIKDFFK